MDTINNQQPIQQPAPASIIPEHKKVGPIVTILIVVLLLIVGALYIFASRMNQSAPSDTTDTTENGADSQPVEVQPITNTSDEVNALEADLNAATNGIDTQNF